jgi:hypothetical protein
MLDSLGLNRKELYKIWCKLASDAKKWQRFDLRAIALLDERFESSRRPDRIILFFDIEFNKYPFVIQVVADKLKCNEL